MKQFKLNTSCKKVIADTVTPVGAYLRVRDHYSRTVLLESSDYHGEEDSVSYIGFGAIASITVEGPELRMRFPDGEKVTKAVAECNVVSEINQFASQFNVVGGDDRFAHAGLFGFIAFDGVQHFEDLKLQKGGTDADTPEMAYTVFRNVIAFNHLNNEAYLFSHDLEGQSDNLADVEAMITRNNVSTFSFSRHGKEQSNFTDQEYAEVVEAGKRHCFRGDVFQIVLSRRFSQEYRGDDFNVYRALRSINPSPYLFYYDFGRFRIFGSSPEAQLIVKDGKSTIHPIAGTFRRTGHDEKDAELAVELSNDPKESAEHVMLVDLARNDLGRSGTDIVVETYKEVQYFSHVIHLVSKVTAKKRKDVDTMQLAADTFPAGTLSGAPKYRALQLIDDYEGQSRNFYGGAIGFMDFKGNFNHAIIIRSFLSVNSKLIYQAGAGVVAASKTENEVQEVYNKLAALKQALEVAETI